MNERLVDFHDFIRDISDKNSVLSLHPKISHQTHQVNKSVLQLFRNETVRDLRLGHLKSLSEVIKSTNENLEIKA